MKYIKVTAKDKIRQKLHIILANIYLTVTIFKKDLTRSSSRVIITTERAPATVARVSYKKITAVFEAGGYLLFLSSKYFAISIINVKTSITSDHVRYIGIALLSGERKRKSSSPN